MNGIYWQRLDTYRVSEKDFGVIDFVRKCEFVLYSQQILDTGSWIDKKRYPLFKPASRNQHPVSVHLLQPSILQKLNINDR
jgi:hypothetical protein